MPNPSPIDSPRRVFDLLDDSTFTYFIPLSRDFSVEGEFNNGADASREPFESVECRESLFFGMSIYFFSSLPRGLLLTILIVRHQMNLPIFTSCLNAPTPTKTIYDPFYLV